MADQIIRARVVWFVVIIRSRDGHSRTVRYNTSEVSRLGDTISGLESCEL